MSWGARSAAYAAKSERFIATEMRRHGYDEDQIREVQEAAHRMADCPNHPKPRTLVTDHSDCCYGEEWKP